MARNYLTGFNDFMLLLVELKKLQLIGFVCNYLSCSSKTTPPHPHQVNFMSLEIKV